LLPLIVTAVPTAPAFGDSVEMVGPEGGGVPIIATRLVDALPAVAVKPGPSTIWLPAVKVTMALLLSVTGAQVAAETVPLQFDRVEAAAYVPESRAPDKFCVSV
jgi:hypothetical protein